MADAVLRINADTSKGSKEVDAFKKKVKEIGASGEAAGQKLGQSLGKATGLGGLSQKFTFAQGAVAGFAASPTAQLLGKILQLLESVFPQTAEALNALDPVRQAEAFATALAEQQVGVTGVDADPAQIKEVINIVLPILEAQQRARGAVKGAAIEASGGALIDAPGNVLRAAGSDIGNFFNIAGQSLFGGSEKRP